MKNNPITIILSLFAILSFSCLNKKDNPENLMDMFPKEKVLAHTVIRKDVFNRPTQIVLHNNYLFVIDYYGKSFVNIYDLNQNKTVLSFLPKGEGPNEATDVPTSVYVINDTTMIWYDASRYVREAIFSQKMDQVKSINKKCELKSVMPILRIAPIAQNGYVGVGLFDKGRYGIFDHFGNSITYKYDYPNDKINCNPIGKAIVYQGDFITNSDYNKILFYTAESEILEFFRTKNLKDFEKVKEIHFDYARYKPIEPVPVIEKSHFCFLRGCSTDKYVYLLYSGVDSKNVANATKGKILLVFDWKGKAVMKYNLDLDVNTIAVDKDDRVLYATTDNPEGALVSFKL